MQRLRYPLAPHDQLFFLHIPKAAGTMLFALLKRKFAPSEILSLHPHDLEQPEVQAQLRTALLVRCHAGYEISQYFVRPPVFLTMLRHPVERVVSQYAAMRRVTVQRPVALEGTIEDYICTVPDNIQTTLIGGQQHNLQTASAQTRLDVAKLNLANFTFVGLQERFDDAVRLMTYTFGWAHIEEYQPRNVSAPDEKPEITAEIRQLILEKNRLDLELYDFAKKLFEERVKLMERELS